jgi:dolichol-phosphate mannosyltransferase
VAARRLFYRLNRLMADNEVILNMAEFSMIASKVRDVMLDNSSTYPFLRTEIGYAGFRRVGIAYDRQPRIFGKSHYNLVRMTAFALGGILSSSTFCSGWRPISPHPCWASTCSWRCSISTTTRPAASACWRRST